MSGCTIDLRTAYASLPQPARLMPVPPWRSLKRSSAGKVERWLRFTRARQIGDAWRKAQCTSSRERAMNKHYPHLADKLPAPNQKLVNIRSLILRWWRTQSESNPSQHPNSLLSGKLTGYSAKYGLIPQSSFENQVMILPA